MSKDTGLGWPGDPPSPSQPPHSPGGPATSPAGAADAPAGASPAEAPLGEVSVHEAPLDEAPAAEAPAAGPDRPARPAARRRRLSAAAAVVGLLVGLLGFAVVVQVKSNATDPELAAARPEDLVRILSDLDTQEDRLRREIAELEETQRQLASGAEGRQAALEEARRRADELGILAGTLPAVGSGLQITFVAQGKPIKAQAILDAVQELRGAGAEAMQIAGNSGVAVRIVASTAFVDAPDGGILAGGQRLVANFTIIAVGDPQTMETALNIPGGVVETIKKDGGTVTVQRPGQVSVTALHRQADLRYAQPAS
jgi:uncharacterized protein YlxW (UPF0749 family)